MTLQTPDKPHRDRDRGGRGSPIFWQNKDIQKRAERVLGTQSVSSLLMLSQKNLARSSGRRLRVGLGKDTPLANSRMAVEART